MTKSLFRKLALAGALLGFLAFPAAAQDSGALLNALVKKGILSDQEAEEIRSELSAASKEAIVSTVSGGKSTHSLAISGRMQVQYAGIDSDAFNVATRNQLFLRRVYFGAKAKVGENWTANLVYDFAGENFDKAFVQYSGDFGDHDFSVDLGVRKVNFGMEESTSSGSLDAIERSGVTRYFVEGNNGRRLGAGSYHVGAYFDGNNAARKQKTDGVFYSFAVTNPERSSGPGGASSSPNNTQAYWADLGYSGFFGGDDANKYRLGVALSSIADAGGRTPTAGSDIKGFNLWGEVEFSNWKIAGEYLAADVDDGLGAGRDASPWGFWVQPSLSLTDTFEVVGRYSYTDSDDRGIKVSDGVRSAPASMTGDNLTELYLGMNYYFSGNDVKFQLGYVHGTAERNGVEESANGVRSQMQLNF